METLPFIRLNAGDIVACWGTDRVSRRISLVTSSMFGPRELRYAPSHVGIGSYYRGQLALFESTTKCDHDCLYAGEKVQGFQVHWPDERISDYVNTGGIVRVYKPTPFSAHVLNAELLEELTNVALELRLKYSFKGAFLSGTNLLKYSQLIPGVDQRDVFCSEIVATFQMCLGMMNLADPRHYSPGSLLRLLCRLGTYQLAQEIRG